MKKIYFSLIICCILILTGCGKNDITKLEKNLSSMELTGDLIVQKVYYHNVADYKKEAQDGFLHMSILTYILIRPFR